MKNLLTLENRAIIAQVAHSNVLCAFDYDGTLAPIVDDPNAAYMRPATASLFTELSRIYPCAVISGRGRDDVAARLGDASVAHIVGNHGLEPSHRLSEFEPLATAAKALLEASLADQQGIELEDKRYSLAVHYRKARQKREARRAIQRAITALPMSMRVVPGKLVFNVVPAQAPNKGDALVRLRASVAADVALYVGDDVTDEDVFKLDQPGRLLSIRIGASQTSSAAYFLRNQSEIDRLLRTLIELGKKRGGAP